MNWPVGPSFNEAEASLPRNPPCVKTLTIIAWMLQ